MKLLFTTIFFLAFSNINAQVKWQNVDSLFAPLPTNVHVYYTNDSLYGKPNIAYYISLPLKNKQLNFTVDTTFERRLTPTEYFEKNNHPLVVVNTTFFEFTHSKNLNTVIQNGKLLGYNLHTIAGKGKDTLTYHHAFGSALGITKKRKADVAWLYTDSFYKKPIAFQQPIALIKDSISLLTKSYVLQNASTIKYSSGILTYGKWRMQTAIGGGPVLLQNGAIQITNNEEQRFNGKNGLTEKHPRTCMGYTKDGNLIIMVIQGRFANIADGATLQQEAEMLKNIGCWEALNLDGGGSSCLLINGKQTITPSDKQGQQRPVPCVFIVKNKG